MVSSLLNLVNNLAEQIPEIKRKYGHNDKEMKLAELNINTATAFFETQT